MPAALILLTPGTADLNAGNARGAGDTALTFRYPGALSVTSSGARADGVNYQLDGGSNRDPYLNVNNPTPNPDALEEFSVQTNSSAPSTATPPAPSSTWSPSPAPTSFMAARFEFFRNGALNARNFFAARHDLIKRNQFGGALGGPIVKNRLFFFGSYQGTILRSVSGASTAVVPTAAQRSGDFSSLLPGTPTGGPDHPPADSPATSFPSAGWIPITAKLFAGLPVPTAADGRVRFDRPDRQSENQVLGRVDYQLTSHRVYGRYFLARYPIDPVMTTDTDFIRTQIGYLYFNQGFSGSDTWTIRPNLLNSFSASYNRNHTDLVSGSTFSVADLGANVAAPADVKELRFGVTGYFSIASSRPAQVYRNSLQFSDSLHWIRGRHELYFGGEALRMNVKNYNPAAPGRLFHLYTQRHRRHGRRHGGLLSRQPRPFAAGRRRIRHPALLVAQPLRAGQCSRHDQSHAQPRPALGSFHSARGGKRQKPVLCSAARNRSATPTRPSATSMPATPAARRAAARISGPSSLRASASLTTSAEREPPRSAAASDFPTSRRSSKPTTR